MCWWRCAIRNRLRASASASCEKTDTRKIDIVVLSVRNVTQAGSGEHSLEADQLFSSSETELFSKVVTWPRRPASTSS